MRWLIDGYNVILSDQKLAKVLRNDNESGRRELLVEIVSSRRFVRQEMAVIFDGRFGASSSREGRKLEVRFTSRGETADDVIKSEIGMSKRRRTLTVVTDDRAIIAFAKECGARTLGSRDFVRLIRERPPDREGDSIFAEKPEPTGSPDPELLKLFTGKRK